MNKDIPKDFRKIEEVLIEIGLKIARRGEGALFIIGNVKYTPLIDQNVPPFYIKENPKLLESLALIDGAVIIDKKGFLVAYGAKIKSDKVLKNHGTRHSAALSASKDNNLSVLISQEDKKVKIFKNEKIIMQIDALEKNIDKTIPQAVNVLESIGVGAIGTIGAGLLVPGLGIALLPGIVVFGSGYYLAKLLANKIKR